MSSDSLPPASSDAKDIATPDDLVCWRAEIVKVIDRGSDKLAVSVAAKFHSNENPADAWEDPKLSRIILRCECREEYQADGTKCISVLAGQVRLYRRAASMKQVRPSRSNSSNRSKRFGGHGTGGDRKFEPIVKQAFSRK